MFPYAPLAGGLLSGRFSGKKEPDATSRLVTSASYYERYYQPGHLEHADAVRTAAERNGHTAVQVALA